MFHFTKRQKYGVSKNCVCVCGKAGADMHKHIRAFPFHSRMFLSHLGLSCLPELSSNHYAKDRIYLMLFYYVNFGCVHIKRLVWLMLAINLFVWSRYHLYLGGRPFPWLLYYHNIIQQPITTAPNA